MIDITKWLDEQADLYDQQGLQSDFEFGCKLAEAATEIRRKDDALRLIATSNIALVSQGLRDLAREALVPDSDSPTPSDQIELYCTKCQSRKFVDRCRDDPPNAVLAHIQCPECVGGDFDSTEYFDDHGLPVRYVDPADSRPTPKTVIHDIEDVLKQIHWWCGREDVAPEKVISGITDLCNFGLDPELRSASCFTCGEKPCTCADQRQPCCDAHTIEDCVKYGCTLTTDESERG